MPRNLTAADIAEFRARLCTAGAELFAEKGFEGFKMRELAERLGISAMTPYRYFRDKDAIISEVRARAFARFADWLEGRLATGDETALSEACVEYALQEPSQYRLMFALIQPASSTRSLQAVQETRVRNVMARYFQALAGQGRLCGDAEDLGNIFWSVLHGTAALAMAGKLSTRELDHILSHTVRVCVRRPADDARYRPANAAYGNGHALP